MWSSEGKLGEFNEIRSNAFSLSIDVGAGKNGNWMPYVLLTMRIYMYLGRCLHSFLIVMFLQNDK